MENSAKQSVPPDRAGSQSSHTMPPAVEGRLRASVQRRRRALGLDIELHESVEQRGLSKEVVAAILISRRCVVSVLKQAEPEP
jgi:hypothetical protein